MIIVTPPTAFAQTPRLIQAKPRSSSKLKPPAVKFSAGPVIPGLQQGAVPQGIGYASAHKKLIISHYFDNRPSCLSVLNSSTGALVATITLKEASGKLHTGHVGGITVMKDALFVASDGQVMQYKLEPIVSDKPPRTMLPVASGESETKASFCAATDELLFVGEFAYGKEYPTDASHHLKDRKGVRKYAWVCGYDAEEPLGDPKCVLSVRQRVQGMCVSDKRIFLSVSYGRKNRSTIVVYRNPIGEAAHSEAKVRNGKTVPLWFLDGDNYLGEIDFPPMSEGIVMIDGRLAVLPESGADKYQAGGKGPLDVIVLLDVSKLP
jgi:hypothetical protein